MPLLRLERGLEEPVVSNTAASSVASPRPTVSMEEAASARTPGPTTRQRHRGRVWQQRREGASEPPSHPFSEPPTDSLCVVQPGRLTCNRTFPATSRPQRSRLPPLRPAACPKWLFPYLAARGGTPSLGVAIGSVGERVRERVPEGRATSFCETYVGASQTKLSFSCFRQTKKRIRSASFLIAIFP
jgi:hypothetical protein